MTKAMIKDDVIGRLRAHEAELRAEGVLHLSLFGSVARGTEKPSSDIDLAAVYDHGKVRTLVDLAGVVRSIRTFAGRDDVDVCDAENLRPRVKASFEREHVRIF